MKTILIGFIILATFTAGYLYYSNKNSVQDYVVDDVKIQASSDGSTCTSGSDCTSGNCTLDVCEACVTYGGSCQQDGQCCTDQCNTTTDSCDLTDNSLEDDTSEEDDTTEEDFMHVTKNYNNIGLNENNLGSNDHGFGEKNPGINRVDPIETIQSVARKKAGQNIEAVIETTMETAA